jgi:hypothetical protein
LVVSPSPVVRKGNVEKVDTQGRCRSSTGCCANLAYLLSQPLQVCYHRTMGRCGKRGVGWFRSGKRSVVSGFLNRPQTASRRTDDKPSAEPNLFELCRGAKEESEANLSITPFAS